MLDNVCFVLFHTDVPVLDNDEARLTLLTFVFAPFLAGLRSGGLIDEDWDCVGLGVYLRL